jgi:hypothetical protein
MYFDRFDIVSAHYAYCVDYHGGQGSKEYATLSRISRYYTSSPMDRGYDSLSDNGKMVYSNLITRHQCKCGMREHGLPCHQSCPAYNPAPWVDPFDAD